MSLTHSIPDVGEWLGAQVPGVRKLAHLTVGSATTNDVVVGDTAVYTLFSVKEPVVIHNVWTQVEEAFTTSVTMTIGDSDSAARFNTDTTINCASTGAVLVTAAGLTVPYVMSSPIDIQMDLNGATVAAGKLNIYVDYTVLED